jgi:MoaD family protein
MPISIKFMGAFRHLSGKKDLTINFQEGCSIKSIVDSITQEVPQLKRTFCDQELNNAKSNSLILVNGKEISVLEGYETKLNDRDEIIFVPVVHGG